MSIKTNTISSLRFRTKELLETMDKVRGIKGEWTALALTVTDPDAQAVDPTLTATQVNAAATVLSDLDTWLQTGTRLKDLLVLRG